MEIGIAIVTLVFAVSGWYFGYKFAQAPDYTEEQRGYCNASIAHIILALVFLVWLIKYCSWNSFIWTGAILVPWTLITLIIMHLEERGSFRIDQKDLHKR